MAKPSFAALLATTAATLPASDPEIIAFLEKHHAQYPSGRAHAKRREVAAALLWLQTLSTDHEADLTKVASLPAALKALAVSSLQLNPQIDSASSGWSKLAIRRAHAWMTGGDSPVKRLDVGDQGRDTRHPDSGQARRRLDTSDSSRSDARDDRARGSSRDRGGSRGLNDGASGSSRDNGGSRDYQRSRSRDSGRGRDRSRSSDRRHHSSGRSPERRGRDSGRCDDPRRDRDSDVDSVRSDSGRGRDSRPSKYPSSGDGRGGDNDDAARSSSAGTWLVDRSDGRGYDRFDGQSSDRQDRRSVRSRSRSPRSSHQSGSQRRSRSRSKDRTRRHARVSCRDDHDPYSSDGSRGGGSGRGGHRSPPRSPSRRYYGSRDSRTDHSSGSCSGSGHPSSSQLLLTLSPDDSAEVLRLTSRDWVRGSELEIALSGRWLPVFGLKRLWSIKDQNAYDKARKDAQEHKDMRFENPLKPGWLHRISFLYAGDQLLTVTGYNLALVARGESLALYDVGKTSDLSELQIYQLFLTELSNKWDTCVQTLQEGVCLAEADQKAFTTIFLQGFTRRYKVLLREVGLASRAAVEVVSHSARQIPEIHALVGSFWEDLAARVVRVSRDARADFYWERVSVLFAPAVNVFLGTTSVRPGEDALGPAPFKVAGAIPEFVTPGVALAGTHALSQSDGAVATASRTTRSKTGLAPSLKAESSAPVAPPAAATASVGQLAPPPFPMYGAPWMLPIPGPFTFGAPPPANAPPPPPPPYVPPSPVKQEPGTPGAAKQKQVQFAVPAAGTPPAPARPGSRAAGQASPSSSDGLDHLYPDGLAFVGKPAHPYVCGLRAVSALGAKSCKPPCMSRACLDVRASDPSTEHATWDCPLRYWAVRNQCPGFLRDGTRDPSAWIGNEITEATRKQWKAFDATLRLSKSAPGPPSFD